MPAGKQQEENVQEPKNNGEKNDLVKGRTLFMDKRYRKRIFYGLVAVVAIGVTIDTLFISPSTSPPTANELNKNDDLLSRSLPTLADIKSFQPDNVSGLYTVSIYSRNDSLKLDYCYPDTVITRAFTPTSHPTSHSNLQPTYQTYLVTIPENENIIPGGNYPEIWIPCMISLVLLGGLLAFEGGRHLTGSIRRKQMIGEDTYLPVLYRKERWSRITVVTIRVVGCLFITTGLLSMSPVPEWLEHARPNADHKKLHPALDLENYCMEPKILLKPEAFGLSASEGNKICELRLRTYLDRPLIEIVRQFGKDEALSEYVYAKDSIPHRFVLTRPDIVQSLKKLYGSQIPLLRISLIREYDDYYTPSSQSAPLPLPAFKIEMDNKEKDLYYFPATVPTYYHYNSNTKLRKQILKTWKNI